MGDALLADSFQLGRWVFLRLLALIYLIAFVSLRGQVLGLLGSNGILPARDFLDGYREGMSRRQRLWYLPTLFWAGCSDRALRMACDAGAALSVAVAVGVLEGPALLLLWVLYLSLVTVGQDFLSFQWDALLLEVGFLAVFLGGWSVSPAENLVAPVSIIYLALFWLAFRLLFESGVVKLSSGDTTWRDLTALKYHYFTQPLPTMAAWYARLLPDAFHRLSVALLYAIEILFPFGFMGPAPLRHFCVLANVALQVLIGLTGNYTFFNLLTAALCLSLMGDSFWSTVLPESVVTAAGRAPAGKLATPVVVVEWLWLGIVALVSVPQLVRSVYRRFRAPLWIRRLEMALAPFRVINAYGLFRVMTVDRPEIVIETSHDGVQWRELEFRYKPGRLDRAPRWNQPHQPRLDWQMWFAALSDFRSTPWFGNFLARLLLGSVPVWKLVTGKSPPTPLPRYARALRYQYQLTSREERRTTGHWWRRELVGTYCPAVSLGEAT